MLRNRSFLLSFSVARDRFRHAKDTNWESHRVAIIFHRRRQAENRIEMTTFKPFVRQQLLLPLLLPILPSGKKLHPTIRRSSKTTYPDRALGGYLPGNISFDHYFATYPVAANLPGEPTFRGEAWYPYGEWAHS